MGAGAGRTGAGGPGGARGGGWPSLAMHRRCVRRCEAQAVAGAGAVHVQVTPSSCSTWTRYDTTASVNGSKEAVAFTGVASFKDRPHLHTVIRSSSVGAATSASVTALITARAPPAAAIAWAVNMKRCFVRSMLPSYSTRGGQFQWPDCGTSLNQIPRKRVKPSSAVGSMTARSTMLPSPGRFPSCAASWRIDVMIAVADGQHLALDRLLLRHVGDDDAARRRLLRGDPLHDDPVLPRSDGHVLLLSNRRASAHAARDGRSVQALPPSSFFRRRSASSRQVVPLRVTLAPPVDGPAAPPAPPPGTP